MANLLNDLVYVDLGDVRDTSDVFSGVVLSDSKLTKIITESQMIIDDYIWYYGVPYVEWQSFIFPVKEEGVSIIPTDIKLATIQIAEYLYLEWPTTLSQLSKKEVKSEKNLSRSVDYSEQASWSYKQFIDSVQIPKKTLNILNKYKSQFISQTV